MRIANRRWNYVENTCTLCGAVVPVRKDYDNKRVKEGRPYRCRSCSGRHRSRKHGMSHNAQQKGHWLWVRWERMKRRCKESSWYLERGIEVCQEWKDDFLVFKEWAEANGADPKLTLDRIDNAGNYEPGNCRWVTHAEQMRNTRRTHKIEVNGKTLCLKDAAREAGIHPDTLHRRIRLGVPRELWLVKGPVKGYTAHSIALRGTQTQPATQAPSGCSLT